MKKIFIFIGIIIGTQFIVSLPVLAGTTYVSGVIDTNSVWDTTGSPYVVIGHVTVDTLVTLDIEPGVEIRLDSAKYIKIKGILNASGTPMNSIIISALDTTKLWSALWLGPGSSGILRYCRIEYALEAIYSEYGNSLYLYYNLISNNNISVDIKGGPATIMNNTITHNGPIGGGIFINSFALATITNNTITHNSSALWNTGGICSTAPSIINNNIIAYNSSSWYTSCGGGIYSVAPSTIINNIIDSNRCSLHGGGIYSAASSIISNNIITRNSADVGGGIWTQDASTISNNIILHNSSVFGDGGGIFAGSYQSDASTISNNIIAYNVTVGSGGGIFNCGSRTISNNIISNNRCWENGGGIHNYGSPTLINNTISHNVAGYGGSAIYNYSGSPQITNCTIIGEIFFKEVADTTVKINYCNLSKGPVPFYKMIYNYTSDSIDATYNYWYTLNTDTIDSWIYDYYDDSTLGVVIYTPILPSGDTIAPVPPPLNLVATQTGADKITMSWDSVPVADLSGYKVWYDTDTSGHPYNGAGANEGNSPIDVGNVTNFDLTGLTQGNTFYLAVTAYDISGDSSWYSNEVIVTLVGVEEESNTKFVTQGFSLGEIHPNPSFGTTVIRYGLPKKTTLSLKLYDISGRLVKIVYSGVQEKGEHKADIECSELTKGIYFIRFEAGDFRATRKLTILR